MNKNLPLAASMNRAIDILIRELGAVDTLRFVNQFRNGFGDHSAEREALFGSISLEEILSEIKAPQADESA